MQPPIAQTKIVIPSRRPDLLSRPRLIDLLYDLIDYRLILAVAPAGYGKTSLFIDFARQTEMPVCWYAVDATDRDLQKFVTYFTSAIVRRFPELNDSILASPQALFLNGLSIDQLVTVLINELYEKIHEHFLIVVDDFHFVDGHAEIDAFVNQFVQLMGEHCHVALLSRTLLSLSDLTLMIARSYVGGLSFEELCFQKAEIRQLLLDNYQITLSEAALDELVESTEGWITGLLLSSLRNNEGNNSWARLARASGIDLYSYLAQQVLDRQPPAIRQFLLHTSLLEEFNAILCTEILGAPPAGQTWQQFIDTIFHDNLFVLNVGEEGSWLRYHHLFQEFLQQTLLRETPDEAENIRRRLAAYYTENQAWEKAHTIYEQLEDVDTLVDLVKCAGSYFVKSGRHLTLLEWLNALPPAVLYADPSLISLLGIVKVERGQVEEGLHLLNRAAAEQQTDNQKIARVYTLIRRAMAYYHLGNYQRALDDVAESFAIIPQGGGNATTDDTEKAMLQAEALRVQGLCQYMVGNFKAAVGYLNESQQWYSRLADHQNQARVTLEISLAHMGAGHYKAAAQYLYKVLDDWRRLHNIMGQANVLNNLGVLYHLQGDYEKALEWLLGALECSRRSGYVRMEAFTLTSMGDLFAELKMTAIATEFYEHAYSIARNINERFLLLHLNLALLLLSLPQERQQDAMMFLDAAGRLVSAESSPFEYGLFRMAVGQYHLMGGRKSEAIAPLEEAVAILAQTDQRVEAARAHLFLAAARQDAGDRSHAVESVVQTFTIAAQLEHWHPLVTAGHQVSHILETIQVDGDCQSKVERLLQQVREFDRITPDLRRRLRQKVVSLLSSTSPQRPRLYIRALGRGEVSLNGALVESSNWQAQAARDLFFCLVAHDEGLSKEEIGEIFWPDATPGQLKTRFKNTIYRLRSALSQEAIVFDNDLYRFNRTMDYEYDIEIFEDAIAVARSASDETQKLTALQRAVDLYLGDFLPEIDDMWAQLERERLWQLYVEATLELAQIQLDAGLASAALTHCQTLLAADPCLESAHRMAMRVHARRGNRADVARQYEQCRTILFDEFGISPSPETNALYDELMA